MKVMICGVDGYIGWPLALHLKNMGHEVMGFDDRTRRMIVDKLGAISATEIKNISERMVIGGFPFYGMSIDQGTELRSLLKLFKPDAVVHLAEIPSAPFSMRNEATAIYTIYTNIIGTMQLLYAMKETCPDTHLVKLGTMGEYGTPNIDIPEGFFEVEYRGRKDRLPFPRQPGSWYHLSKVHDSLNIEFACKIWGLRSTDIMQGVVFGLLTEEIDGTNLDMMTRFDFDEAFGTVLNRYCAEAVIGHELTPYGVGGQTRGFIPLRDSLQCIRLIIENPPGKGEYRVVNQFEETFSVNELAGKVIRNAWKLSLPEVKIADTRNPRIEKEEHYYNPEREILPKLGYRPTISVDREIVNTIDTLIPYINRIELYEKTLEPKTKWRS